MHAEAMALIQQIRQERMPEALDFLRGLIEYDDEPITEWDIAMVRRGRAWLASRGGEGLTRQEVMDRLGLTQADIDAAPDAD